MLFNLGHTVCTPAALRFCQEHGINLLHLFARHASGDWGDLDAADVQSNVQAIQHDLRLFSAYQFPQGKVWVITEADRSSTCALLAEEY